MKTVPAVLAALALLLPGAAGAASGFGLGVLVPGATLWEDGFVDLPSTLLLQAEVFAGPLRLEPEVGIGFVRLDPSGDRTLLRTGLSIAPWFDVSGDVRGWAGVRGGLGWHTGGEGSLLPSGGAILGFERRVTERFGLGAEARIVYTSIRPVDPDPGAPTYGHVGAELVFTARVLGG